MVKKKLITSSNISNKHSHKKLWAVVIIQFLIFLFLFLATDSNIADFNKGINSFNTDQYREAIRKAVQEDIDKSFTKYQADLDKSIASYGNSVEVSNDLESKVDSLQYKVDNIGKRVCDLVGDLVDKIREIQREIGKPDIIILCSFY